MNLVIVNNSVIFKLSRLYLIVIYNESVISGSPLGLLEFLKGG